MGWASDIMLDTEAQWSEALDNNNIRAVIRWLRHLTSEGGAGVEDCLLTFSGWVQRTSEFVKKELLTLCFSRCQGLWMFLDQNSFTRIHVLLQRLKNLLTLAQWARGQLPSVHLWHGVGVPCVMCSRLSDSCDVTLGCWRRAHRTLKQHIWLGQLVQWWGIMGLLPRFLDAQELKRIDQMWKDMKHSHRRAQLQPHTETEAEGGSYGSLIQGMVMQLDPGQGCIWSSQACTEQIYPPPNLQSLLKLVLLPHTNSISVQALLMYFTLDVVNFLQCKDDLLQAFCQAFTIPPNFSNQIRAFWMFDHGHVTASMQLLLSPSATAPNLCWQHRCIINKLLTRKQPHVALRYLKHVRPPQETDEDSRLFAEVLLQCRSASEAWVLLKGSHTLSEDALTYFFQVCKASGLKYVPAAFDSDDNYRGVKATKLSLRSEERQPCPLSAALYQAQTLKSVSSDDLIHLTRKAVMEARKPDPRMSCRVWPVHTHTTAESREMFLLTQALHHLTPSTTPVNDGEETLQATQTDDQEEEQHAVYNLLLEINDHKTLSQDLNLSSIHSFSSTSPCPPLKPEPPYVYERTLTLQRISSLLADGENQFSDEENHESESQPFSDSSSSLAELLLTPDSESDKSLELMVESKACSNPEVGSVTDNPAASLGDLQPAMPPTCQDRQTDLHQSSEDSAPRSSAGRRQHQHSSLPSASCLALLTSVPSSKTHRLSSNIRTCDAPFENPRESLHGVCCKHGGPDTLSRPLEASRGFLSARKDEVDFKPESQRPSFSSPYACSRLTSDEFPLKDKSDNKQQAEKAEPPGWTRPGKTPQGAVRGGRARARKGKRLKRV